jgi:tellurite resistance protein TehA-like permease
LTTAAAGALGLFSRQRQILTTGTLVIWCLAMAWLSSLVSCEILRPRLRYDVRRWATVFPLGMYAACSFAVGQVTGVIPVREQRVAHPCPRRRPRQAALIRTAVTATVA